MTPITPTPTTTDIRDIIFKRTWIIMVQKNITFSLSEFVVCKDSHKHCLTSNRYSFPVNILLLRHLCTWLCHLIWGTLMSVPLSLLITLSNTSGVFLAEAGEIPRHPLAWQMGNSLAISPTRPGPEAFWRTPAALSLCKTPPQKSCRRNQLFPCLVLLMN